MQALEFRKAGGKWKCELMLTEPTVIHIERKSAGRFNIAERLPGTANYVATEDAQGKVWGSDINTCLVSAVYPMEVSLVSHSEVVSAGRS